MYIPNNTISGLGFIYEPSAINWALNFVLVVGLVAIAIPICAYGVARLSTILGSHKNAINKPKPKKKGGNMIGRISWLILLSTLGFMGLRITGYTDWGWVWVFSPLWIGAILATIVILMVLILIKSILRRK